MPSYPKANILIDNAGNAVLCDFGLSRVKADIASRTNVIDVAPVAGSRNWMAPEILIGGTLRKFARHLCFWDGYLRGTLSLAE